MKRCTHPASILHRNSKDEVFVCRRCGQVIFPTPVVTPDDEFAEWDKSLCWHCGGTGINVVADSCEVCDGEGYVIEIEE